jgi:hypothetical protein
MVEYMSILTHTLKNDYERDKHISTQSISYRALAIYFKSPVIPPPHFLKIFLGLGFEHRALCFLSRQSAT